MKLPKIFCKIFGHKKALVIGADFATDMPEVALATYCKRCLELLEVKK